MLNQIAKKAGFIKLKNFVNVRIQTSNHTKELNDIKHNLRKNASLSAEENNTKKNFHYVRNNETQKWEKFNDGAGYDKLVNQLSYHRKQHNKLFKEKNKRNVRDRNATFLNGVITFSEKMEKDFKENNIDNKLFVNDTLKTIKMLEKQLETECLTFSIHRDEKNIHIHFTMLNYDNQGNSIYYKNRTKDKLSVLQDIGFKGFKDNWGIERGISKDKPVKNVSLKEYYEKEKAKVINNYNKDIQDYKEEHKTLIEQTKKLRNEVSSLNLSNEEKKELHSQISSNQKLIRSLRSEISSLEKDNKEMNEDNTTLYTHLHNNKIQFEKNFEVIKNEMNKYKKDFEELKQKIKDKDFLLLQLEKIEKTTQKSKEKNHSITF
jgi:hypothetical protein